MSASAFTPASSKLGLLEGLTQVADISNDTVGQALASAELHAKRDGDRRKEQRDHRR